MIKLTKAQQKQFDSLSRRFKITKREYLDLYSGIRKARAKANRLLKEGQTLKVQKMSLTLKWIKNREDFLKTRKNVKKILDRNYKAKVNHSQRQNLYNNILRYFGKKDGMDLIQEFSQLTDYELLEFFQINDDIDQVIYDSKTEILDIIGMTKDKMMNRLEIYATYGF